MKMAGQKMLKSFISKYLDRHSIFVKITVFNAKKCSCRIKSMYRQARSFSRTLKRTLCQALVQSHLDYATPSWYAAMTQKAKNKLQILQNKKISFTPDLGPRAHTTEEHMKELNMLRIPRRVKQLRLNTAHKKIYDKNPSHLNTNFN